MNYFHVSASTSKKWLFLWLILMYPLSSLAVDAGEMLERVNDQLPALFQLVSAFAYLGGIFFIIRGLLQLKEYGESQGRAGGQHGHLTGPLSFIFIGAMLVYLPSAKDTLLTTFYGTTQVTPYVGYGTVETSATEMGTVLVNIVRFVGLVSFIRGLFLFHKVGSHHGQPGTFNKGVTHAVGGAIAMNIVGFINIIERTLGFNVT